jgi:S1-C subfamily serine protease
VSSVDWIIVAFTVLLAIYGYAQGFLVGALSLAGFGIGAFLGTRIAPLVLPAGAHSRYAPIFGLLGALIAGGILATGFEGLAVHARRILRVPGLRLLDGMLGAALTACVALGVAWIVGAIALQSSGSASLRRDIERSSILRALDQTLPPSGPILNALARFDPLPSVRGPSADVAPPSHGIVANGAVRAAARSVVRVVGTACGLGVEGTGWAAGSDLIVTNAHVVAGENDAAVEIGGNPPALPARPVLFDPHDDIAILRVPHLGLRALALAADTAPGTPAAILGYPLDGPFDIEAGRLGQTETVNTEDAYGNGPVQRDIATLRGLVRPGNSGGPMVNDRGEVVATVFAAIVGSNTRGGFAVPNRLVGAALKRARATRGAVGTGACAG